MHRSVLVVSIVLLYASCALFAQDPGTVPMTPMVTGGLVPTKIEVPEKYRNVSGSIGERTVNVPAGWRVSVFYVGAALSKPRFMAWGPDSVLYVANMNGQNVLALPDVDRDGVADTVIEAATGFSTGHDVRFWRDTMFVCQQAGVVTLTDPDGDHRWTNRQTRIDRTVVPNWSGGRHGTRTLVVDTVKRRLVVSVGSNGNADREAESGKLQRAMIEAYDLDGTNRRIIATGIRNAVGMTLHPRTGALWATNNGSDLQGDNVPPEWVDIIRDGGFYGYPFAYQHQNWFDLQNGDYRDVLPLTSADTALFRSMVPPAALLTAHMAPMAIEFVPDGFPEPFSHGCFVALRGSWNRTPASGYKVVFLSFDADADTVANSVRDICTGFMTDSVQKQSWARPVGLAIHRNGSVYMSSDDQAQMILKLTPPTPTSVQTSALIDRQSVQIRPNPTERWCTIVWSLVGEGPVSVDLVDSKGVTVVHIQVLGSDLRDNGLRLDLSRIGVGRYEVRCMQADVLVTAPVVIQR